MTTPVADAEPAIAVPAAADPPPALVLALPDLAAVPPSGTSTPRSALTDAFSLCCQSSTDMAAEAAAVAASLAAALAKVGARVGLRLVGGWVARTHRHSCTQCARALFGSVQQRSFGAAACARLDLARALPNVLAAAAAGA